MENYICTNCGKTQNISDFGTTSTSKRYMTCKSCRERRAWPQQPTPEANGLHRERPARPQQPQQPMPEAIEHDDDYFWSVYDKLGLKNILTSLIDPLSRGNEKGQEEVITSIYQVSGIFPYDSSTVQQCYRGSHSCNYIRYDIKWENSCIICTDTVKY